MPGRGKGDVDVDEDCLVFYSSDRMITRTFPMDSDGLDI